MTVINILFLSRHSILANNQSDWLPVTDYPGASRSFPRGIAGSWYEIGAGPPSCRGNKAEINTFEKISLKYCLQTIDLNSKMVNKIPRRRSTTKCSSILNNFT